MMEEIVKGTLNELKTLSHVHLWVTINPGLPKIVSFMPAFLAYILADPLSLLKISLSGW